MNFKIKKSTFGFFVLVWVLLILVNCSPKSKLTEANGDIKVKIPVSEFSEGRSSYKLQTVTLKNIYNLKEVSGQFAQFFYAPGLKSGNLIGDSPKARFSKTKDDVYLPTDSISQQMAVLYYHIQKLTEFAQIAHPAFHQVSPFKVGIEAKVLESSEITTNNAFYDGQSDALLFVPFTLQEIPISVNSGIIAHEYFHSIFYKNVIQLKMDRPTDTAEQKKNKIYHETLIRGFNEGLADYWGWLYSNDEDFIRWSLSAFSKNRKLNLTEQNKGQFQTTENIISKAELALINSSMSNDDPMSSLNEYIYRIGTPVARFLKEFTILSQNINAVTFENKILMAQFLMRFLDHIVKVSESLKSTEILEADILFKFITLEQSKIKMNEAQCLFVMSYLKNNEDFLNKSCQKQSDLSYQILSATEFQQPENSELNSSEMVSLSDDGSL